MSKLGFKGYQWMLAVAALLSAVGCSTQVESGDGEVGTEDNATPGDLEPGSDEGDERVGEDASALTSKQTTTSCGWKCGFPFPAPPCQWVCTTSTKWVESCSHSPYETGGSLVPVCESCVASVCAMDSFCCTNLWDSQCVGEYQASCAGACTHSKCDTGGNLDRNCDACVRTICATDPFCCDSEWDQQCVNEVSTICNGLTCN